MNAFIKQLTADKIIRWSMYGMIGIFIFSIAYLALLYNRLPPYLPLFNQLPWGDPRLGIRLEVFVPLGLVLVFGMGNLIFSLAIYRIIPLISRMLAVTGFLVFLITLIFLIRVTQLVL